MHNPEELEMIVHECLTHEELRHCSDYIEEEITGQIVVRNGAQLLVCARLLYEIKEYLDRVDNIDCIFYFDEVLLRLVDSHVFLLLFDPDHVNLLEDKYEWRNEQCVNS